MNSQWLGRKGHRSLPCREKGTGPWAHGLKKQEGIPPTSDSDTINAYTPVPSQNWLLWTMLSNMTRRPGLCHSIKPR